MERGMPLLLALALAAQPADQGPLVTRNPDGSVTLVRTIEAEPPPLAILTHGVAEGEWERKAKRKRRQREEERFEADLDEAFEEAADAERASRPD
jgi:hypothetical protein